MEGTCSDAVSSECGDQMTISKSKLSIDATCSAGGDSKAIDTGSHNDEGSNIAMVEEIASEPTGNEKVDVDSESTALHDSEDYIVPETLEDLEHKFVLEDGVRKLRDKENCPFKFQFSESNSVNQKRYERIGEAITQHIYALLEDEYHLRKEYIPELNDKIDEADNAIPKEERGFIFVSEGAFTTTDRLLVLIHGSGVVRAGQWARRIIINDNLESGTQFPYIRLARMTSVEREAERAEEQWKAKNVNLDDGDDNDDDNNKKDDDDNEKDDDDAKVNKDTKSTGQSGEKKEHFETQSVEENDKSSVSSGEKNDNAAKNNKCVGQSGEKNENSAMKSVEKNDHKPLSAAAKEDLSCSSLSDGRYEIVILNTNQNTYQKNHKSYPIRESENPEQHARYVWKHYIEGKVKAQHIAIVAHSYGGVVVTDLAEEFGEAFRQRVFGVAFTDSVHSLGYSSESNKIGEFLSENARNWVTSSNELDYPVPTYHKDRDAPCVSAGTNTHEWTSDKSKHSVFKFLEEKYQERIRKIQTSTSSADDSGDTGPPSKSLSDPLQSESLYQGGSDASCGANLLESDPREGSGSTSFTCEGV